MALTKERIFAISAPIFDGGNRHPRAELQLARAIEAAACADRDARIAELERKLAYANEVIEQRNAQCSELFKDAERYRWLRDQHWVEPEATFRLNLDECDDLQTYHQRINEAIDAAMQKGQQ